MKIKFKNFRCHKNKSFEIPDSGLVLLSGESGVGKTTILNAISYALYGKLRKPYSHGTNTCQVDLQYRNLDIQRSSRPNRLLVTYKGIEYEDDAAEGVIQDAIGMNIKEFMASSYIVQNL